jgi:hypothetical protein
MAHPFKKLDPFILSGALFATWALTNTYIDILRYGWDQGFYWWFCNLALIGTSFGLLFKHRGWLTGFLSIACFTQIFWVIDNQYRVFTGRNLFGLVEFMYQPGLPLDEFLLSHYHYFTIPVAVIALIYLPPKKSNALLLISIFNPLIFGVSYFLFPASQNVNCIHQPCFPGLVDWAGPLYSFVFWGIIFLVHLGIGYTLENFLSRAQFSAAFKRRALWVFVAFCSLACVNATLDTRYRLSLPSFTCNSTSLSSLQVKCGFTLDAGPERMKFNYSLKSLTSKPQVCFTYFTLEGQTIPIHSNLFVFPEQELKTNVIIPYPKKSVEVNLSADCSDLTQ